MIVDIRRGGKNIVEMMQLLSLVQRLEVASPASAVEPSRMPAAPKRPTSRPDYALRSFRVTEMAPELRTDRPPTLTVRVPEWTVMRQIEEELDAVRREVGYVETGGWLWRRGRTRSGVVEISLASGPGPHAEYGSHSLRLSRHDAEATDQTIDGHWNGLQLCGEWHLHPEGGPDPSSADLRAWAALVDSTQGPYVAAIVTRDETGTPQLAAWEVRSLDGRVVVDPCRVLIV